MLDTSNINSLINSLPNACPDEVNRILSLQILGKNESRSFTRELCTRGFIGCVPFAKTYNDFLVVRILPNTPLQNSVIGVIFENSCNAMTIAPGFQHFIAGRLAQLDRADPEMPIEATVKEQVLLFAENFGPKDSTERALDALGEISLNNDMTKRIGALWKAAADNESLFLQLHYAWCFHYDKLKEHLNDIARLEKPNLIAKRLLFTYLEYSEPERYFQEDQYLLDLATDIILGDDVFDPFYTAFHTISSLKERRNEPLITAVNWMKTKTKSLPDFRLPPEKIPEPIWKAVCNFADNPYKYNGEEHIKAAKYVSQESPQLSYTLLANAANYFANSAKSPPETAIKTAHELAQKNNWSDLETVLGWCCEK